MYSPVRTSRSRHIPVRTLNYHVRQWGEPVAGTPPLVLLHGWMDVAASYQFVVDAFSEGFAQGRVILAPDWRGFGLSTLPSPCDHYNFPDYLADLDLLLDDLVGTEPVDLVGHSMGGNIAMMYAGVRPDRIRRLVNLEGFGLPATRPEQAPKRYAQWIDEVKQLHQGDKTLKTYDSAEGVVQRLMKTNPRLSQDKPSGWCSTGHSPTRKGAGRFWATRPTRSPVRSSTGWTRPWRFMSALPRRCSPLTPAATA